MLDQMVEFAATPQCRLGVVLKYFGETGSEACGHCDNCRLARDGRRGIRPIGKRMRASGRGASSDAIGLDDPHRPLFEKLRAWRKQRADIDSVPAYVVFADRVLVELARSKPTDIIRLSNVSGVGEVKREKYGRELLHLIADHDADNR